MKRRGSEVIGMVSLTATVPGGGPGGPTLEDRPRRQIAAGLNGVGHIGRRASEFQRQILIGAGGGNCRSGYSHGYSAQFLGGYDGA